MTPFEQALQHTLGIEGGYSDDAVDSGGETNFGLTEAIARLFGFKGEMKDLTLGFARGVYRQAYWDLLHLDLVAVISPLVATEIFENAVHSGPASAAYSLQRCLNAFNREQTDYPDLEVDNLIGPATLRALRAFVVKRGPEGINVLFEALNCLQGAFYIKLVESRTKDEKFVYGWFKNRVS